jgi:hypothetical protein
MRSMVEGALRWHGEEAGPLHRAARGPPPRPGEEFFTRTLRAGTS